MEDHSPQDYTGRNATAEPEACEIQHHRVNEHNQVKAAEALDLLSRVPNSHQDDVLRKLLIGKEHTYDHDLPEMGEGKPIPPPLPNRRPYRVEFMGDNDPYYPMNWPLRKRLVISAVLAYATMNSTFASAIYGSASNTVKEVFHVGTSVAQLGTFAFVLGFALGPCIWGPSSEYFGRKMPLVIATLMMTCFSFGSATAKDFQTLILCRFFAGASGSACVTVVPGAYADLYDSHHRGTAASVFALCVAGGPMLSPVVGSFVDHSYLGWRWCLYLTGIMSSLSLVLLVFFYEETYHPIVLIRKAEELRNRTGIWGIYANHELVSLSPVHIAKTSIVRPVRMLTVEPILLLISLYGGFVYGLLYMSLGAVPYMYQTSYGWQTGVIGLPYISMLIGCAIETMMSVLYFEPRYNRALDKSGLPVVPEERLITMMVGAPIFSIGIFWMFWTGAYPLTEEHPHGCHFMVPIIGGAFFGYGFLAIFMPMINYVLDSYLMLAASGMAANTFLRSIMGAVFPLFTLQMFKNLGIQWAGTLVGCLSVILIPIPYLFWRFGGAIRRRSKFAVDLSEEDSDEETEQGSQRKSALNRDSSSFKTAAEGSC